MIKEITVFQNNFASRVQQGSQKEPNINILHTPLSTIFNTSFPRTVRIEPTTCRAYSYTPVPLYH